MDAAPANGPAPTERAGRCRIHSGVTIDARSPAPFQRFEGADEMRAAVDYLQRRLV